MAAAATFLARSVLLAAALAAAPAVAEPRLVTVTGEARVQVAPDAAQVTAGVAIQGKTAKEALDQNSRSFSEVMKLLREAGIPETDIRTAGISLQPIMSYNTTPEGGRSPRLVGYQVTNSVTIKVASLPRLGELLDRLVAAGANQLSDVRFLISDESSRRDAARAEAIKDARRKAELYASAAGTRLGRVHSIAEQDSSPPHRPVAMRAASPEAAGAVPIAPGQETLTVGVVVTWELEN